MKGLEKMTALILEEARASADALLADARREAETVEADYSTRAAAERDADIGKARGEAAMLIHRAEASAQQIRRNTLLETKSTLLDAAFDRALNSLVSLPDAERLELYSTILDGVVTEQLAAERAAAENDPYGEYTVPDRYAILLSDSDRTAIGDDFLAKARALLKPAGKAVTLSDRTLSMAGGFVLVCGDVELCCALSGYMEQIRSKIEGEVCQILFA